MTVISCISIISPIRSHADSLTFTKGSGGAVPSVYFDSGTTAVEAEDWKVISGSSSAIVSNSNDKSLRVSSRTSSAGASTEFTDGLDIGKHRETGIYIRSLVDAMCTVTLSVQHDKGISSVTAQISAGNEFYVFTPLPEDAGNITGISFTASFSTARNTDNVITASVMVRKAVLSATNHTDTAERYSAFITEGIGKDRTVSSDTPVNAKPILTDASGDSFAIRVTLDGAGGGITVHFAPDGENFGVCGSAVITEGRSTYLFHAGEITAESEYRLEFTGTDNFSVRLEGVDLIPVKRPNLSDDLGTVSKCAIADNILTVSGSITRDAAVKHIKGDVCIYEIPMWQDAESVLEGEPLDFINMSTSFSFTLPVSKDHSVFSSYIVAIREEDGVYPLTDPIFPSGSLLPEVRSSTGAVAGISPEDAFTAGFDNYVIEIDTSSFFLEKSGQNSTVITHDGTSYYPDKDAVSELDRKVNFLSSAGIGVIFRVTDSAAGEFDPESEQDCRDLASAVSFLSGKYSPYGFIIGSASVTEEDQPISDSAYVAASLVRLASASAGEGCIIYTPVVSSGESESFAWLVSEYMSYMPRSNWEILLAKDPDDSKEHIDAVAACAADGGYTSQITVFAETIGNDASVTATDIGGEAGRSYLLYITDGTSPEISANGWEFHTVSTEWDGGNDDTVTLWDFTNSYDSGGFTIPAGPTGIFTGDSAVLESFTGIPACRALKTVLGKDSNVIMAQPAAPMSLTDLPLVRFLLAGEAETPFSIDIVFISGKERAVFTAKFDQSGVYAPVCDLSETGIADRVERIAIVLKQGGPVELGIATITATGNGDASVAEETLYITEAPVITTPPIVTEAPDNDLSTVIYAAVGVLMVVTIVIFAALSRKKT